MRAKVIIPTAGFAVLVLLLAFHYHFAPATPAPVPPADPASADVSTASNQAAAPRQLWAVSSHQTEEVPVPDAMPADPDGSEVALDPVTARIAQLTDLGGSNDPVSLKTLLSELNDQNMRIRKAALDATVQFGSQDALPALRNQLSWTDDAHEKAAIQDAIDFLQLPPADSAQAQPADNAPPN